MKKAPANEDEEGRLGLVLFAVAAAALVGVGLVVPLTQPANPDIAWLSYAAERYLSGATPYVDLIEINPPAILFFNLPAAWIASAFDVDGPIVYTLFVVVLALLSVASTVHLLWSRDDHFRARLIALLLLFVLFPVAGAHFGQREHVMLVLALPWLAAASERLVGREVPSRTATGVGLLAGVGFALKPHFLLVGAAVEGLLWVRRDRSGVVAVRIENRIVAAMLVLYLLSVFALTPEYFDLVGALGQEYAGYLNAPIASHVMQPFMLVIVGGLLAWMLVFRAGARSPFAGVLVSATLAALVMAAVQMKGWAYHYYPALALSVLLAGFAAVADENGGEARVTWPKVGRWSALVVLALAGLLVSDSILEAVDERAPLAERTRAVATRIESRCDSPRVVVFSPDAESAFPLVTRDGIRWGLSISSLWPLSAAYEQQVRERGDVRWRPPGAATPAERFVASRVVTDLTLVAPDLILVDRRASRRAFGPRGFGYMAYFEREPELRTVLARYRSVGDWNGYRVWIDEASRSCSASGLLQEEPTSA